jgi:hypothetical protein
MIGTMARRRVIQQPATPAPPTPSRRLDTGPVRFDVLNASRGEEPWSDVSQGQPLPADAESRDASSYPLNGYLCSVCYRVQYDTPHGAVCDQGHGGVDGIEPPHQPDCAFLAGATTECSPEPGDCARKAADGGWRPGDMPPCAGCGNFPNLDIYEHRSATCSKDCHVAARCSRSGPGGCRCDAERATLKVDRGDGHFLGCGEHIRKECPHTPETCPENNAGGGTCYESVLFICARCDQAEGELAKTCPAGCVEGCPKRVTEAVEAYTEALQAVPVDHPGPELERPESATARVRFVEVPTTPLVQVERVDGEHPDVKGAIVKVAPTIRSSERETFDGARVMAKLREAGALAVQLAPVTLPDTVAPEARRQVARAQSPEDAIRAFFAEFKGVPEEERAEAEALALELLEADRG